MLRYKTYQPSLLERITFHSACFLLPKMAPFISICYYAKEYIQALKYNSQLNKILQITTDSGNQIIVEARPSVSFDMVSIVAGLALSLMSAQALLQSPDEYIKTWGLYELGDSRVCTSNGARNFLVTMALEIILCQGKQRPYCYFYNNDDDTEVSSEIWEHCREIKLLDQEDLMISSSANIQEMI